MDVKTPYEQMFFTTAFIRSNYPDGRIGSGTGFFYGVNVAADQIMLFLVTNKHVINGATSVSVNLIAGTGPEMQSPLLGRVHEITLPPAIFEGHPSTDIDVAAAPISPWINALQSQGKWAFFRSLSPTLALTSKMEETLDALEDVTFIGYPNGLYDKLNYLPIARRGITATPVAVEYEGNPTFLVDASVFPGSSGSPVFIAQSGGYSPKGGGFVIGGRIILLGIMAAVYQRQVPLIQVPTEAGSAVMDPLNIGIVYKAKTIEETVDFVLTKYNLKRHSSQPESPVITPTVSKDPAIESTAE